MRSYFHYFRFGWSVIFGTIAVLLVVLWVRSYCWHDAIQGPYLNNQRIDLISWQGRIHVIVNNFDSYSWTRAWEHHATRTDKWQKMLDTAAGWGRLIPEPTILLVQFRRRLLLGWEANASCWFLIALTISLTLIPWSNSLKCRFSLRTLLIATTLIALIMGLVVYFAN